MHVCPAPWGRRCDLNSFSGVKPVQVQTGRRTVPHPVIAVRELYMQHRNILGSAYRTFNHVPSAPPLLPPPMLQQILHRSVIKTPVQSVIKVGRTDAGFDWAMKPRTAAPPQLDTQKPSLKCSRWLLVIICQVLWPVVCKTWQDLQARRFFFCFFPFLFRWLQSFAE